MVLKRHAQILRILETEGTVTIAALANRLGVSSETVRRDLRPLAARGAAIRMHGAVAIPTASSEAPFQRRMRENSEAKQVIARHLASTIRNGESILMDTGTTTSYLARALIGHLRLTVITNSSEAARILAGRGENRVFLAGGEVRGDSGALLGASATAFVKQFRATHAVISAGAIDQGGILDFDPDEADFARTLLARGDRRIVLSDATKFTRHGLVQVCGFAGIDEIVTNAAPPPAILSELRAQDTRLVVADAG